MTLENAILLATQKHAGQMDKAGEPYILHPLRVMLSLTGEEEQIVGVLHDILEDTPTTHSDLRELGFFAKVIEAIEALTRMEGEGYSNFIARIRKNPLAKIVKIADLEDNMQTKRLAKLPLGEALRLHEKYAVALAQLHDEPKCKKCGDTGVFETGNNDLPCDCPAGDTALFNSAFVDGPITGAEMRRHFLNNSPEPIQPRRDPIPASSLPGRRK